MSFNKVVYLCLVQMDEQIVLCASISFVIIFNLCIVTCLSIVQLYSNILFCQLSVSETLSYFSVTAFSVTNKDVCTFSLFFNGCVRFVMQVSETTFSSMKCSYCSVTKPNKVTNTTDKT